MNKTFWHFYRRNEIPIIFVALFSISSLLILKFIKSHENYQPPKYFQNINEIIVPPSSLPDTGLRIKYSETKMRLNTCLNREKYQNEFLNFVHVSSDDPKTYKSKFTIVIGSKTTIGAAIIRKLREKRVPVIEITGPYDINFPDDQSNGLFGNITIQQLFICSQPNYPVSSKGSPAQYYIRSIEVFIKNILQWSSMRKIPTTCIFTPPFPESIFSTITWFGASVVLVPHIPEVTQFDDLENPFVKVYQDCAYIGESNLSMTKYPVIGVQSDTVAETIIEITKDDLIGITEITSPVKENIQDLMTEFVEEFPDRCSVKFTKAYFGNPPKVEDSKIIRIGKADANIKEMLKQSVSKIQEGSTKRPSTKPYLSIVVTGSNNNYAGGFAKLLQSYVDSIGRSAFKAPQSSVELIIVDFPNAVNKATLKTAIKVPKALKGCVKFIEAPKEFNEKDQFPEFLGKNIGIRNAEGEFILVTNPDTFLPAQLFEIASRHQFNKNVLYRAVKLDNNGSIPFEQFPIAAENPWTVYGSESFTSKCQRYSGFYILRNKSEYEASTGCESMNFMLASKELWFAINGFTEFPYNNNFDVFQQARFMKVVPGIPVMFLPFEIFHIKHEQPAKSNPLNINCDSGIYQYYCYGDSDANPDYSDSLNWGSASSDLKIEVK